MSRFEDDNGAMLAHKLSQTSSRDRKQPRCPPMVPPDEKSYRKCQPTPLPPVISPDSSPDVLNSPQGIEVEARVYQTVFVSDTSHQLAPSPPPPPNNVAIGRNFSTENVCRVGKVAFRPTGNRSTYHLNQLCDHCATVNGIQYVSEVPSYCEQPKHSHYEAAMMSPYPAAVDVAVASDADYSQLAGSKENRFGVSRKKRLINRLFWWTSMVVTSVTLSIILVNYLLPLFQTVDNGARAQDNRSSREHQHSNCLSCGNGSSEVRCCSLSPPSSNDISPRQIQGTSDLPTSADRVQCAAHVFLRTTTDNNNRCQQQQISQAFKTIDDWNDLGDSAFVRQHCVNFSNGTFFTIQQSGYYTIYSHLAFSGPIRNHVIYGHQIFVTGSKMAKLADYQVLSPNDSPRPDIPVHNSALMATVRLRARETLWVTAQPAECIYRQNGMSYFGFFRQATTAYGTGDYSQQHRP